MGQNWADDLEDDALKGLLPGFIRNSVISKKPSSGSLLALPKNTGTVSMTDHPVGEHVEGWHCTPLS